MNTSLVQGTIGSTAIIPLDEWHHIAGTYDGATVKVYVDGQLEGQVALPGPMQANPSTMSIGAKFADGIPRFPFNGLVDEVELYDRALPLAEIQAAYAAGGAGHCKDPQTCLPDLVSWWPGETVPGDAIAQNHGAMGGGAGFAPGRVGQAFDFNGGGAYLDVGGSAALAPQTMTVSYWMYARSVRPDNTQTMSRWGNSSGSPNSWIFDYQPNQHMYFTVRNTSGGNGTAGSAGSIPFNEWHHVAGTYDGATVRVYLDGVLGSTAALAGPMQVNASTTSIGCKIADGSTHFPFDGLIDEPQVYHRVLSDAEIADLVAAGNAGRPTCRTRINTRPTIVGVPPIAEVDEHTALSFDANASDADLPPQTLTFGMIGAPLGAAIDPSTGVFTWTPGEAQGPGDYAVTVRVTDDGFPPLMDSAVVAIHVDEVNAPPVLSEIGDRSVLEGSKLAFTAGATDPDLPANALGFSLDPGAPAGAAIDPLTGEFSWTPAASANYALTVRVADGGSPARSDSERVSITVGSAFEGRAHWPLGGATIAHPQPEVLRVQGIGGSGGDGVRIALPPSASALEIGFRLPDEASVPVGAYLEGSSRGPQGDSLAFTRMTKTGPGVYQITGAIAGKATKTLAVFSGGTELYRDTRSRDLIDAITPRGTSMNDQAGGPLSPFLVRWRWEGPSAIRVINRPGGAPDTTVTGDELRILDPEPPAGIAYEALSEFLLRGSGLGEFDIDFESQKSVGAPLPAESADRLWLEAPVPDPSPSGAASLAFRLRRDEAVTFELLDVAGRCVARRALQPLSAGRHSITWQTEVRQPGLYFVRLATVSGDAMVRRWVILR